MKKKLLLALTALLAVLCMAGCGSKKAQDSEKSGDSTKTYKVGIVQYVDDASLNQIQKSVQDELDKKGKEAGVKFDYKDYTFNGQADQSTLNQIMTELV